MPDAPKPDNYDPKAMAAKYTADFNERRDKFIRAIAHFLVDDQAIKSVKLQAGNAQAKEWAAMRNASPLHGYPTAEEAFFTIKDYLTQDAVELGQNLAAYSDTARED